jgi:hypothetical protein
LGSLITQKLGFKVSFFRGHNYPDTSISGYPHSR